MVGGHVLGGGGGVLASLSGGGSGFAPNKPAGLTTLLDRQWNPTDPSIPGGILPPPSLSGSDSTGYTWANGDGASQVPLINTIASLSTSTGISIPALPDGHATAMMIHYPSGEAGGTCPFQLFPTAGLSVQKIYLCCYVFMPTGFNSNGNNIKWSGVESHGGTGSANHIFMLSSGGTGDYRADWMVLQGGHGNQELGGESSPTGFVTALTYPPQGTGQGWWLSMQGQWMMLEWFAQQESNPGVSSDGIYKSWVTIPGQSSTLINYWNNLIFNGSGDPDAFNNSSIIPYYGGGGGSAPSDQYLGVGRWYVATGN